MMPSGKFMYGLAAVIAMIYLVGGIGPVHVCETNKVWIGVQTDAAACARQC
jgi:hypothetical protein